MSIFPIKYNNFTQTKPLSSYPTQVIRNIKLISLSKNKNAVPFGSYIYRLQKYPGDIDLLEEFTTCCNLDDLINKFEKTLQYVVREIINERVHYISEIKVGIDNRYNIDIGTIMNGIYKPTSYLSEITYQMYSAGLLTVNENNIIQYILKNRIHGGNEYDTIYYIFREHRILRWTPEEILLGYKILPLNKKITLKEAIPHKVPVKIDMITPINGVFTEVTNFIQLAYVDNENELNDVEFKGGDLHIVNIDLKVENNIPIKMPQEIEKLYYSDMYYSPFKMVKRMYSLARNTHNKYLLDKIIYVVSSNISLMYQIQSEISTLILLLEKFKFSAYKSMKAELNNMKMRLSVVIELNISDIENLNNMIDRINATTGNFNKIPLLKKVKDCLKYFINFFTIKYLNMNGLNPPPRNILPNILKYDPSIRRTEREKVENPYNLYLKIVSEFKNVLKPNNQFENIEFRDEKEVIDENNQFLDIGPGEQAIETPSTIKPIIDENNQFLDIRPGEQEAGHPVPEEINKIIEEEKKHIIKEDEKNILLMKIKELQDKNVDLINKLEEEKNINSELKDRIELYQIEVEIIYKRLDNLTKYVTNLEIDIQKLKKEYAELEKEYNDVEQRNIDLYTQLHPWYPEFLKKLNKGVESKGSGGYEYNYVTKPQELVFKYPQILENNYHYDTDPITSKNYVYSNVPYKITTPQTYINEYPEVLNGEYVYRTSAGCTTCSGKNVLYQQHQNNILQNLN